MASDNEIFVAMSDGHLIVVDIDQKVVRRNVELNLPAGRRVPWGMLELDRERKKLYIGVGMRALPDRDETQEVWAFDTQNWNRTGSFQLPPGVFSIALSPDGENLYAVSPEQRMLTVIDANSGRGRAGLGDLGNRPSLILTAPSP